MAEQLLSLGAGPFSVPYGARLLRCIEDAYLGEISIAGCTLSVVGAAPRSALSFSEKSRCSTLCQGGAQGISKR